MYEGGECGWGAMEGSEWRQRQGTPDEGELAVMVMPEPGEQQRTGRDGQKDADER
jgi:hypothetical protein